MTPLTMARGGGPNHARVTKSVKSADRQTHLRLLGQAAVDKRKAFKAALSVLAV